MFEACELDLLIRGNDQIDLEGLKKKCKYVGMKKKKNKMVEWFWEFAFGLEVTGQKKLLKFITGSDRIKSTGEVLELALNKNLTGEHLPTANTCINRMNLPEYENAD